MTNLIEMERVSKEYKRGAETVKALKGVSLTVKEGDFLAITGSSGSGKSTLLQLLGGMDTPSSGTLKLGGEDLASLSDAKLARIRSRSVGFVFQQFFLIPTLTALENVELACLFARSESKGRAKQLLERLGLGARLDHYPTELSGGEMQRVAIARALVNQPKVLLADEPTGSLDSQNAEAIMKIFEDLNGQGQSIVIVTHNPEVSRRAHRSIALKDGQIASL